MTTVLVEQTAELKHCSPLLAAWLDDVPTVLVRNGDLCTQAMNATRVEVDDVLEAARVQQGIESLAEIRHAVLERDGKISILPWPGDEASQSRTDATGRTAS